MATVQVIRKNKSNGLNDTLGVLGQGLAGFGSGYLGGQRMNVAKQNADTMSEMAKAQTEYYRKMMERMWGADGSGINPAPTAMPTTLDGIMPQLDLTAWR